MLIKHNMIGQKDLQLNKKVSREMYLLEFKKRFIVVSLIYFEPIKFKL